MAHDRVFFRLGMILYTLTLASLGAGEAVAQELKCFILTPPEQILAGVRQVAIADFTVTSRHEIQPKPSGKKNIDKVLDTIERVAVSGKEDKPQPFADAGKKLADLLIASMVEADRGIRSVGSGFLGMKRKEGRSFQAGARTNVFVVVERQRMDQLLEELKLGQSGLVDESQAAQVGRLLGVDAIVTGQINAAVKESWEAETRTTTKGSGKNKTEEKKEVWCNKRIATVSATIRIVNVETGQLFGTREASSKQELKHCEDERSTEMAPADQTVNLCLQTIAKELIDYFMPRFQQQKFEFAKIEGKEFKRPADAARESIDGYDLHSAFINYSAILEQDPYNHAAIFNLGVLHEVVGNYALAVEKYRTAASLVSREEKYRKALQRVEKQRLYWDELKGLGLELKEYDFSFTEKQASSTLSRRIRINGQGSERIPLYEKPDDSSKVLVRVPGGVELETASTAGEWYQVKLLDGRLAWIHEQEVEEVD
ncbi:MAG TPA: CsgG/HfaB family protein [bacterium]|nr:CsgG/HfaB family protein [bacterium]